VLGAPSRQLVARYVAWCRRWRAAIVAAHLAVTAVAVYLIAFHLPLYADFSYLLPQDAPAVRDLRKLEARVTTPDIVLAIVVAPDARTRAAAGAELATAVAALPNDLVERVQSDDAEPRAFLRARRYLFVPYEDLVAAHAGLERYIKSAKLAANPFYISLDDAPKHADRAELDDLRARLHRGETRLDRSRFASADGRTARIEIRAAFRSTDPTTGHRLLAALADIRARVIAAHPDVDIGFTGSVVFAVVEHDAIASGILWSSLVTAALVALVVALYFRSAVLLVLLVATIAVATAAAFGVAALTVGHLNAATAFLGAVIAGNGINYGIILVARYLEARRREDIDDALALAIVATARPTAVASLCASVAYASLAASSFQGFADFAVIGGVGMALCWIATYVLLPVLIQRWGGAARAAERESPLGAALVRLLGFSRRGAVLAPAGALVAAALAIAVVYIAADPFEYDSKRLRSESADAIEARRWLAIADREFGREYTGRTFIAADDPAQVPLIVDALRARERALPEAARAIGAIDSILDLVPPRQPDKLRVLADIRRLVDDALPELDDRDAAELRELRPPDQLAAITAADLPASLREPLTERNGDIGNVIAIRPADRIDDWNGHDLVAFSNAVRRLELPDGATVTTSGPSVIFVDVLAAIVEDTPVITTLATLGIVVVVVLVVGWTRRAAAVIGATAAGSLVMIAACALADIQVNFLNFIALPITLGLGVDYAVNVAQRAADCDVATTLRTAGAAVFVCSLTTIIGYASLLVGDNLAIRGFGKAALIGEVTSVGTALVLVPALLARYRGTHG
jgi:predicted RND superfamily exporter protein